MFEVVKKFFSSLVFVALSLLCLACEKVEMTGNLSRSIVIKSETVDAGETWPVSYTDYEKIPEGKNEIVITDKGKWVQMSFKDTQGFMVSFTIPEKNIEDIQGFYSAESIGQDFDLDVEYTGVDKGRVQTIVYMEENCSESKLASRRVRKTYIMQEVSVQLTFTEKNINPAVFRGKLDHLVEKIIKLEKTPCSLTPNRLEYEETQEYL